MTPQKKWALILIAAGLVMAATSAAFDLSPYSWLRDGASAPLNEDSKGVALWEQV